MELLGHLMGTQHDVCPCPGEALALQWLMAEGEVGFVPSFLPRGCFAGAVGFLISGRRRDEVLSVCKSLLVLEQGLEVPWANVDGLL